MAGRAAQPDLFHGGTEGAAGATRRDGQPLRGQAGKLSSMPEAHALATGLLRARFFRLYAFFAKSSGAI